MSSAQIILGMQKSGICTVCTSEGEVKWPSVMCMYHNPLELLDYNSTIMYSVNQDIPGKAYKL